MKEKIKKEYLIAGGAVLSVIAVIAVVIIIIAVASGSKSSEDNKETTNKAGEQITSQKEDKTEQDKEDESTGEEESSEENQSTGEDESTSQGETTASERETKGEAVTTGTGSETPGNSQGTENQTVKPQDSQGATQQTTNPSQEVNDNAVATGTAIKNRVSVHDPSIIVGTDKQGKKCYYIFGSHMAWAKSYDLQNWTTFTNNINSDYRNIFKEAYDWADNGDSVYNPSGNLWAPDIIYNTTMKKWCMYMSVNGCSWNSSIVLLTADSLEGNWTYAGTVIYSGFTASGTYSYTQTDYAKATGDNDFTRAAKYYKNPDSYKDGNTSCEATTWNNSTGAHAIDPCVVYDKNGNLWMSYGSWSGGVWIIQLDESTGLRDYSVKYEESDLTNAVTDPYMGKKISGATGASGEGAYIVYDKETDYYYMYVSYGWLGADGGYHIRLFRSSNIDGTYTDFDGTRANARGSNRDGIGIKLFGNYTFSSLSTNNANAYKGYKSGGHNSAFIDSDGSRYLIYHTRFNLGNEWHQVRVHQQFMNEDGWPVTAVYEYLGSSISASGYSISDMAGQYEMVNMGTDSRTANVGMLSTSKITLNSNGTISGAVSGTWTYKNQYVTMTIGGVTYKGVFFKQYNESSRHEEVMTFTLIGNDTAVWGTK